MLYPTVSLLIIILGFYKAIKNIIELESFDYNGVLLSLSSGFDLIFLGLLNFFYLFENPSHSLTKWLLLLTNLVYIGYALTSLIKTGDNLHLCSSVCLVLTSILINNKKV